MQYTHLSDTVSIKVVSEKDNKGVFYIEGLYTGYGVTLGNALRRALLSSLPGAAITKVKIKGVDHEFSTLPGMKEDILEFTLNLKKVRFHFIGNEPLVLKLDFKGEGEVKAGDIEDNAFARVINKDLHLATLTKKTARLEAELTVEKGLGYVVAESRRSERVSVGDIMLDAIFSPIVRVAYEVEDMRVGERTDYNRLKIEIETDGSITPSEALYKTAKVLEDHFVKIHKALKGEEGETLDEEESKSEKSKKSKKGE
jgi:DNA-directed RNA polymerase subunit alpha